MDNQDTTPDPGSDRDLVFALLAAAAAMTRRFDGSLSTIKGISLSEYQLLSALGGGPGEKATRVDLAARVGLTPSGVTRALKPLEKLGFVETVKDGRDARRSLAVLTTQGAELVADATGVVGDVIDDLDELAALSMADRERLITLLDGLARV